MRRFCTGRISRAAARTQPVRPFGRPGMLIRYQVGFLVLVALTTSRARTYCGRKSGRNCFKTASRLALAFGSASTEIRFQAIVPDPTTSTFVTLEGPAPAPGASDSAIANASIAAEATASHGLTGI